MAGPMDDQLNMNSNGSKTVMLRNVHNQSKLQVLFWSSYNCWVEMSSKQEISNTEDIYNAALQ